MAQRRGGEGSGAMMRREDTLRAQAETAIRGMIITGEIAQGELYSAPELAKQLGVSATPVREAMLDLVTEGLVESVRYRGFRVLALEEKDLDDITHIRVLLEAPTVAALTHSPEALTPDVVKSLRAQCAEMVSAAASNRVSDFIAIDRAFHLDLLRLAGNARLVAIVERLRNSTLRYGLRSMDRERFVGIAQEHNRIVDLLLEGNESALHDLVAEHVLANRGILGAANREPEIQVDPSS